MKKSAAIIGLIISMLIVIAGEFERLHLGWGGGGHSISMAGAGFCIAFGISLLFTHLQDNHPIKLGSESCRH